MSLRNSEYRRNEFDFYETPEWVTAALMPFLGRGRHIIWEPCAGRGRMKREIERHGHECWASDINLPEGRLIADGIVPRVITPDAGTIWQLDFLKDDPIQEFSGIITNSPFGELAPLFLRRALTLAQSKWCPKGFVAMLLPMAFDAAIGRRDLFAEHPAFDKKIVLHQRIVWMEREDGKRAAPSMHHAFYLWDFARAGGPATTHYV